MHLVIVWVATIGLDGGSGLYRGLGVLFFCLLLFEGHYSTKSTFHVLLSI